MCFRFQKRMFFNKCLKYLETPRNHGIELDSVAFNAAMTAALEAGHADQALQLMRGMTQKLAVTKGVSYVEKSHQMRETIGNSMKSHMT